MWQRYFGGYFRLLEGGDGNYALLEQTKEVKYGVEASDSILATFKEKNYFEGI